MASTEGFLDHASEEAISLGSDRANEFRAVVGLNSDLGEIKAMGAEVVEAEGYEPGGVEGGELIGIADEGSAGEDVFDSVFELRQDAALHKGVDMGDVVEILDVQLPMTQGLEELAIASYFTFLLILFLSGADEFEFMKYPVDGGR